MYKNSGSSIDIRLSMSVTLTTTTFRSLIGMMCVMFLIASGTPCVHAAGCSGRREVDVRKSSADEKGETDWKGGAAGLCCVGKNNTCVADGSRLNDLESSTCFCDENCIEIGDCCVDYALTCPVTDCLLSEEWGTWSDCSASCGLGHKTRTRDILIAPTNGGRPCDVNTQKMSCEGQRCKIARSHQGHDELKERARIVPAQFGSWRNNKLYNPFQDIRKNLFEHYVRTNTIDRPSYCAQFEVVDVYSACKNSKLDWPKRLKRGVTLCVECQSFSMKPELGGRCLGHGVYKRPTYWKAMTVPGCQGRWVMTSQTHEDGCQCDPNNDNSFILI